MGKMAGPTVYYIHESWAEGRFTATLHRADCISCNFGTGQVVGSYLTRGKWHGPYKRTQAIAKLASLPAITLRLSCTCTL
jgi:hypothetical protein